MTENQITIVGGGLAGCLMAILLRRRKFDVVLFEGRDDPRTRATHGGRSINLALSLRGLSALEAAGLAESALDLAIPMRGRQIHSLDGAEHFQAYSANTNEYINSISREGLNTLLVDKAEAAGVDLRFNQRCTNVDFENRTIFVEDVSTGSSRSFKPNRLIAADGAGSVVRQAMVDSNHSVADSEFLDHAYKELTIPASFTGDHRLKPVEALHIWPRKAFMLIALPNLDGSYTCTLFLARTGEESFDAIPTAIEAKAFFDQQFPDVIDLMPDFHQDFDKNPVSSLGTVRCKPWHVDDFCLLIGDAAHAIVPFYGQGMNCAFEDCLVIDKMMDNDRWDWGSLFAEYSRTRREDADAIADLALMNFLEMRDSVSDPRFMLRKKLEHELATRFPNLYVPVYSHVTFSTIRYNLALQFGKRQADALDAFLEGIDSIDEVDWRAAESLVVTQSRWQARAMETSTKMAPRTGE